MQRGEFTHFIIHGMATQLQMVNGIVSHANLSRFCFLLSPQLQTGTTSICPIGRVRSRQNFDQSSANATSQKTATLQVQKLPHQKSATSKSFTIFFLPSGSQLLPLAWPVQLSQPHRGRHSHGSDCLGRNRCRHHVMVQAITICF